MSDAPTESAGSGSGPQPGGGSRGKTIAIVVLAIVLALVIAAIIWLLVARNGTQPTAATTSPTPAVTPTPTATAATPRPTPTTTPAVARCTTDQLSVTLGSSNGAAGSTIVPIVFTNTGNTPCELHGFPGVSFVGDGNGTQLGAAADQDTSVAITQNTLAPGSSVQAPLKVSQAQNYQGCTVVTADGFRVYPPHSTTAVFVKSSAFQACSNPSIHLLTVQPVQSK